MSKIYNSADELIGRTPLLRLNNIEKKYNLSACILAKLEMLNPCGSIKDRAAKNMIDKAEEEGKLSPGAVIIEPTSGNTGIGLASVAAVRGYKAVIVMPESMSKERRMLMKAYGAELVLTPASEGMSGAIKKAEEIHRETPGSIVVGQFENPHNPEAHFLSTGPEIYEDTDGNVDIFVACVGTGGTLTGVGRFLKSKNPSVRVVAVEPASSPLLSGGEAGAHKIQGIGANFIPEVFDKNIYDEIITVSDEEAYAFAREIGQSEGFLAGISSGAALCASVKIAKREENRGKNIAVIFPDSGERYLSSGLYD